MKPPIAILTALVALTVPAFSQGGALTPPPGAAAPTMKSLDQVEPRIPLVAGSPGVAIGAFGNINIFQLGSYCLTGDLQITGNCDGITISTSGVSLDLMGYSVIAPASGDALSAILLEANHGNIRIHNGHIVSYTTFGGGGTFTGSGFFFGVSILPGASNISITNVSVRGSRSTGMIFHDGQSCIVANCSVFISGGNGIRNLNGTVTDSVVHTAGNIGIEASVVSNCRVDNAIFAGIVAATVSNSYAQSNGFFSDGITATSVINSFGFTSGSHGISATTVSNSRGISTNLSSDRHGINAVGGQVSGSRGEAAGGHGISAASVSDSVGSTTGAHGINSSGISANRVSNSQGTASIASGGRGISGIYSVTASYGTSSGASGIRCTDGTISNSYGRSTGSSTNARGIQAQIVTNSQGVSSHASGGPGVAASRLAMNSIGISSGSSGLTAGWAAMNCFGFTSHTAVESHGISSNGTVSNSYGQSDGTGGGDGINASVVTNSRGFAAAGARHGIWATEILESSYGLRASSAAEEFGIRANRASLSRGLNGQNITHPYNMP